LRDSHLYRELLSGLRLGRLHSLAPRGSAKHDNGCESALIQLHPKGGSFQGFRHKAAVSENSGTQDDDCVGLSNHLRNAPSFTNFVPQGGKSRQHNCHDETSSHPPQSNHQCVKLFHVLSYRSMSGRLWMPYLILVVVLTISLAASAYTSRAAQESDQARFDNR